MEEIDQLNNLQGVQGTIILRMPDTILRTTFDDDQTSKIIKASLPFVQLCQKSINTVQLGSVRSMKREIVFTLEQDCLILTVINMGSKK
ncbi:Dynein_light chain [Hexamita inflata]|uniref:Dynein light chain n=1 Tax=Hexamita inflata TaxID=28002 RepID=A0AA86PFS2_9EUKA|nr:Dynein light chain [Hexamita inflata]